MALLHNYYHDDNNLVPLTLRYHCDDTTYKPCPIVTIVLTIDFRTPLVTIVMTIHIQTPPHGDYCYDDADSYYCYDEGSVDPPYNCF